MLLLQTLSGRRLILTRLCLTDEATEMQLALTASNTKGIYDAMAKLVVGLGEEEGGHSSSDDGAFCVSVLFYIMPWYCVTAVLSYCH